MAGPTGIDRRSFLAGGAALGVAATAGAGFAAASGDTGDRFPLPTTGDTVRVLVTGDAGTGEAPQYAVTAAARAVHAAAPFDVALGLGDNIYETGPDGPDDAQFQAKFEKPNAGLDFPWLMALGNHDNTAIIPGDGGFLLKGNLEVDYHRRSRRWYMPARYYSVALPTQAPIVEFFVLDVNPLASYLPALLSPEWGPDGAFMRRQAAWLDKALATSTAPWKIVCTHHAYISNGSHGDAGEFDRLPPPLNGIALKRFIEKHVAGRAQFLFSGHDHTQQVLDSVPALKGTRQIVSGAAAKASTGASSGEHPARYQNLRDRGFMALAVTASTLELVAHAVNPAAGAREDFRTTYRR